MGHEDSARIGEATQCSRLASGSLGWCVALACVRTTTTLAILTRSIAHATQIHPFESGDIKIIHSVLWGIDIEGHEPSRTVHGTIADPTASALYHACTRNVGRNVSRILIHGREGVVEPIESIYVHTTLPRIVPEFEVVRIIESGRVARVRLIDSRIRAKNHLPIQMWERRCVIEVEVGLRVAACVAAGLDC